MSVENMRGTLRHLAEGPRDVVPVITGFEEWTEGYNAALRAVAVLAKKALEGEPELEGDLNDTF